MTETSIAPARRKTRRRHLLPRVLSDVLIVLATALALAVAVDDPMQRVGALAVLAVVAGLVIAARPRRRRRRP